MSAEGLERACVEGRSLAFRIIIFLPGLAFACCFYGFVFFVIGIGFMNPKLPQYYAVVSLFAQFLPLLISAGSFVAWLATLRARWLKWCLLWLMLLGAGTYGLQSIQPHLPAGPDREKAPLQEGSASLDRMVVLMVMAGQTMPEGHDLP
ncbi:hypothetical protein [Chromobacterium phragmitis]|uniref:Uncharacterized protein n=1 Tax=Chromobacterium phragmitis TaxID=2202141 RepID=A0ABV0ITE9_9NEIS